MELVQFPVTVDTAQLARECYQLATSTYFDGASMRYKKVPNRIRFVAHSMGGMFVSRYVAEPESRYEETGGKSEFYQWHAKTGILLKAIRGGLG